MNISELKALCEDVTRADVVIEDIGDNRLHVSVHWPETQGDEGDYCHGQNTIVREAWKVLGALESVGWHRTGRDLGHHGGTTAFSIRRLGY